MLKSPVKLSFSTFSISVLLLLSVQVLAIELNDYVNPTYVYTSSNSTDTMSSRQAIVEAADHLAQSGPWSARSGETIAASGDKGDYLSWAPEYWPDCNWCSSSAATTSSATQTTTTITQRRRWRKRLDDTTSSIIGTDTASDTGTTSTASEEMFSDETAPPTPPTPPTSTTSEAVSESTSSVSDTEQDEPTPDYFKPPAVGPHLAAKKTTASIIQATSTTYMSSSAEDFSSTASSTTASRPSGSCRPSPTASMPPSATWTSCPYVRRPGQINPDTRDLPAYSALSTSTDATLLNALAFAFTGSRSYATDAISYIRTMFIDENTAINPNGMYGQVIRGPPGNQTGSFEGTFDFRSLVKVVNAIQILKAGNMSEGVEEGMRAWAGKYRTWLEGSEQGRNATQSPNHYSTSIYGQWAALYILEGDESSAASVLEQYFAGPFQSQITSTGEQPYEASQANPFHARCTNIGAMILNAKLGAFLNLDFWSVRSSAGATIRDSVDHTMQLDPGGEDANELLPHVAAVAAAYGDDDGRYRRFLESSGVDYQSQIWWFFDQPEAVRNTKQSKRELRPSEQSKEEIETALIIEEDNTSVDSTSSTIMSSSGSGASSPGTTTGSLASTSSIYTTSSPSQSITTSTSDLQSSTSTPTSTVTPDSVSSVHTNSASEVMYDPSASAIAPEQPTSNPAGTNGETPATQMSEALSTKHEQTISVSTATGSTATATSSVALSNASTSSASTNSPSTPSSASTPEEEGERQNLVTSASQQEAGPLTVEDLALALGLGPLPVRRSHVLRPRRHDSYGWKGMVRRFAEGF